jgi:dolichol-phosphate mannosyltransferase
MLGAVVPCYNEEDALEDFVKGFEGFRESFDFDLVFVDDGSDDETPEILRKLSKGREWIKVVTHEENMGLAQSLKNGFSYALKEGYDLIAQMDSDLTHPPRLLKKMMDEINGSDLVIASRYVKGGGMTGVPGWRVALSRVGNNVFRFFLGIKTLDATSGFRLGKREVYERIELEADSFGIQLELTVRAEREGFIIKEFPFVLANRERGVSKFKLSYLLRYLPLVLKLFVKR